MIKKQNVKTSLIKGSIALTKLSDMKLLEIIEGCCLEFVDNWYPFQTSKSYEQ